MHQYSRLPPTTASPANSEQTNPIRSNNPRSTQASGSSEEFSRPASGNTAAMQRLNQVVQNFYTKAALIILHSRAELSPAYSSKNNERRVNKWFNIELDETEDYSDDIKGWRKIDIQLERPPPLIIEVYLTTEALPQGQRLVVVDDDQKRWDVYNALEPKSSKRRSDDAREILLERWTIELGDSNQPLPADLAAILPHVYKKSIVLFRALYTYCNFLPAWKLIRKLGKSRSTMGMKVGFRIVDGDRLDSIPRADNLRTPLYDSTDVVTEYSFGSTESPAGPFSVQVKYRTNCNFRVDDSEKLLSSGFVSDDLFRPQKVGSLPNDQRKNLMERPELGHAYGSMSTFHQVGISPGTSPISALKAQKEFGDSPSPRPLPQQARSEQKTTRRSSFNIQPFKTPTLAASPLGASPLGSSPRVSTRAVPTLGSLEEEPVRPSNSPRPAPVQRFQSSFSHRRNRPSVDRTTKTDEESSNKSSPASSGQPGSGLMTAQDGSSESIHADDENISDFLSMLDTKKGLLNASSSSALEASARRTAAALNRFHKMRDSNAALSESMSSSLVVPKQSPSPKPASPHTPHTPFAPSRLSAAYSQNDEPDEELKVEAEAGAIDIPNSPRPFVPEYRRSSSVQRPPVSSDDDIGDLYGGRSASMGTKPATQPIEKPKAPQQDGTISDSGSGRSIPQRFRTRPSPGSSIGAGGSVEKESTSASGSWRGGRLQQIPRPERTDDDDDTGFMPFAMDQSMNPAKGG